jgi:hypothetical protein
LLKDVSELVAFSQFVVACFSIESRADRFIEFQTRGTTSGCPSSEPVFLDSGQEKKAIGSKRFELETLSAICVLYRTQAALGAMPLSN